MSLEQYLTHTAARVKVTLPINWGSERKVAYISMERDCAEAIPDDDTMKMRVMELIDLCQQVADRRAPAPGPAAVQKPKQFPCKYKCGATVKWNYPYTQGDHPVNLDGSKHECQGGNR